MQSILNERKKRGVCNRSKPNKEQLRAELLVLSAGRMAGSSGYLSSSWGAGTPANRRQEDLSALAHSCAVKATQACNEEEIHQGEQ